MEATLGTCELCHKRVATYVPTGGDGQVRLVRQHKCGPRRKCPPGTKALPEA